MSRIIVLVMVLVGGALLLRPVQERASAQVAVSNTPVDVNIPTVAPPATAGATPTPIPPTFTPTVEGPPQLEVLSDAGEVNVRAEPGLDSDVLGTIRAGTTYTVTGRYFRWLQFRFDPSPTRIGYVYDELVQIVSGDEADIPDLSQTGLATQDIAVISATETAQALRQTPGFEFTLTADALFVEAPSGGLSAPEGTEEAQPALEVLPTFTYPFTPVAQAATPGPEVQPSPTPEPGDVVADAEGVAPIVPIVVLGSLGLITLLLSTLRR